MDISIKLSQKNGIATERYQEYLIKKIREKYTMNDELAILRQRDTKPEEFAEYIRAHIRGLTSFVFKVGKYRQMLRYLF